MNPAHCLADRQCRGMGHQRADGADRAAAAGRWIAYPRSAQLGVARIRYAGRVLAPQGGARRSRHHSDPVDQRVGLPELRACRRGRPRRRLGVHGPRLHYKSGDAVLLARAIP